jgi:hypothetical protein
MSDLDLLVPAIAIVALFGVVGLIVQSVRHGRAIRKVEELLHDSGGAASEASLDRIRQLQTRAKVSTGVRRGTGPAITIAALLGVAVLAGGAWFFLSGGDGDGGGQASGQEQPATTDGNGQTTPGDETTPDEENPPDDGETTPTDPQTSTEVTPLANKAEVTVAIFNASGIQGAAGTKTRGILEAEGYSFGIIDNSPDGATGISQTQVMWAEDKEEVARNVAQDLEVSLVGPLDGLTPDQIGAADVAVIVGLDVANRP